MTLFGADILLGRWLSSLHPAIVTGQVPNLKTVRLSAANIAADARIVLVGRHMVGVMAVCALQCLGLPYSNLRKPGSA